MGLAGGLGVHLWSKSMKTCLWYFLKWTYYLLISLHWSYNLKLLIFSCVVGLYWNGILWIDIKGNEKLIYISKVEMQHSLFGIGEKLTSVLRYEIISIIHCNDLALYTAGLGTTRQTLGEWLRTELHNMLCLNQSRFLLWYQIPWPIGSSVDNIVISHTGKFNRMEFFAFLFPLNLFVVAYVYGMEILCWHVNISCSMYRLYSSCFRESGSSWLRRFGEKIDF